MLQAFLPIKERLLQHVVDMPLSEIKIAYAQLEMCTLADVRALYT